MSNSLYEEAIKAADEIKNAAEAKAKKKIIQSISPKIKTLVENAISSQEDSYNVYDDLDDVNDIEGQRSDDFEDELDQTSLDDILDDEVLQDTRSEESDDLNLDKDLTDSSENDQMSNEAVSLFKKIVSENSKRNVVKEKLKDLKESIISLKKAILLSENNKISDRSSRKIIETYKLLCNELKNIKFSSIIKSDKTLLKEYLELSKELKNMSTRRNRNSYLNESLEDLLEMDLFEEDEEEEEGDEEDTSISQEDLADALEPLMGLAGIGEEEGEEEGDEDDFGDMEDGEEFADMEDEEDEDEDEDEDEEDEDEDDEDKEIEESFYLGESDEYIDEDDEFMDLDLEGLDDSSLEEDMDDELYSESSRRKGDLFLEIDESMLKREISKMRRIRENEELMGMEDLDDVPMDEMDDEFMDLDDVPMDEMDDELIDVDDSLELEMKNEAARRAVRKNRKLNSKLVQYKKTLRGMKRQLSEMNLFNAKLLYANKLMQNRDLSMKQQRHIVESLDNAKTINEAKLLFTSLSKSLTRGRNTGRRLSEGSNRRLIGSSSRSTASAQKLNENVALDRWATLAGIKK